MSPNPLVSAILTTHDRPRFLPIALECYRHQTYQHRELIVVDDSLEPLDEEMVTAVGGTLIRMERGTPLGTKFNRGQAAARGSLCQKMDDDDWKGPRFMEEMVRGYVQDRSQLCRPVLAGVAPFLFFDLAGWTIRIDAESLSQATFLIARDDWEDCPYRPVSRTEDMWFLGEQQAQGTTLLGIPATESFLQVRHGTHLWTGMPSGHSVGEYLDLCPVYPKTPEELLPDWAVRAYREIQHELWGSAAV